MKTIFSLSFLILLATGLTGCATTEDLQRVRGELEQKITIAVDSKMAIVETNLNALKSETSAVHSEMEKNRETLATVRKSATGTGADVADVRENIQLVKAQLDALRKDLAAAVTRSNRGDEESKEIREKLNSALFKLNFIEDFLGIGKREGQTEGTEKGEKVKDISKGKLDKESFYAAAYELFKDGKFEKAREMFQNFLKQYPDTEYSDNAQFWIAECYYFEKKYENAILEYEKVSKNYPEGDKVPYALLKEGITFINLGDKVSAKLILQRVIKDYPNTNQARTAKATLLDIK